jgi:hypothetical protein
VQRWKLETHDDFPAFHRIAYGLCDLRDPSRLGRDDGVVGAGQRFDDACGADGRADVSQADRLDDDWDCELGLGFARNRAPTGWDRRERDSEKNDDWRLGDRRLGDGKFYRPKPDRPITYRPLAT